LATEPFVCGRDLPALDTLRQPGRLGQGLPATPTRPVVPGRQIVGVMLCIGTARSVPSIDSIFARPGAAVVAENCGRYSHRLTARPVGTLATEATAYPPDQGDCRPWQTRALATSA